MVAFEGLREDYQNRNLETISGIGFKLSFMIFTQKTEKKGKERIGKQEKYTTAPSEPRYIIIKFGFFLNLLIDYCNVDHNGNRSWMLRQRFSSISHNMSLKKNALS